ncbi:MAG: amidohydrolase family protein [Deltaproteobacteria bacterium]|nr:amidohydrolase family protein [Deltaproteobacteria bacterium]
MKRAAVLALAACGSTPHPAPAPADRVLSYTVVTVGRPSGSGEIRIGADGTRREHFTYNDRGRGPEITTTLRVDASGAIVAMHATGHAYLKAPVDESLVPREGVLEWTSSIDHGSAPIGSGLYVASDGPFDGAGLLANALAHAPGKRMHLLPAGEAWIEDDRTVEVDIAGSPHTLHQVAIAGLNFSPLLVWLDEHGEYFGEVSAWMSTIRAGAEAAIPALVKRDNAWRADRDAKLAEKSAHPPPEQGLAFVHANVFDSETKTVRHDATVVVVGDAITAIGDAKTPVPQGARVIDATGKTLLPGLWDMHTHIGPGDGAMDLAAGVTVVRDLGNDITDLMEREARFRGGLELGPRVVRAGLIDGPGPFAAPTGVLVETPEQALAAVRRYHDLAYVQIKIYSSVKPSLVPVIAQLAHQFGMRVSGHIPFGMNAADAVEAGYDEIQHANFLFLRFLAKPTDDTRTPLRFTLVAQKAASLDLDSPEVTAFLDLLVAHHTVLDPTLGAFDHEFVSDPGDLDPVLAPYADQLPASVVRSGRSGSLPAEKGQRAIYRASFEALGKLIKRAWDKKITIVAGTDGVAGLPLSRELELYVHFGIPAPEVLALATLGAARVMHLDKESGSIAPGKRADLVLVDGDPTQDIAQIRNTRVVVCRGVAYDPAELWQASGMRPRP